MGRQTDTHLIVRWTDRISYRRTQIQCYFPLQIQSFHCQATYICTFKPCGWKLSAHSLGGPSGSFVTFFSQTQFISFTLMNYFPNRQCFQVCGKEFRARGKAHLSISKDFSNRRGLTCSCAPLCRFPPPGSLVSTTTKISEGEFPVFFRGHGTVIKLSESVVTDVGAALGPL